LEEWGDDDGFGPMPDPTDDTTVANKNSRVVVLKHMFTLDDLEKDATLLLDLKEDVREECSSLGEVTNVVLYDVRFPTPTSLTPRLKFSQKEKDGVMTVKFRDPLGAQACVLVCKSPHIYIFYSVEIL
jgi:HIV Tat-specific factor 1